MIQHIFNCSLCCDELWYCISFFFQEKKKESVHKFLPKPKILIHKNDFLVSKFAKSDFIKPLLNLQF